MSARRARHAEPQPSAFDDREQVLASRPEAHRVREGSRGNFKDLESLLDQLGSAPVFELGKPVPEEKFLLRMRAGSCPATHNRALLDKQKH